MLVPLLACHGMSVIISQLAWVRLSPAQPHSWAVLEMLGTASLFLPSIVGAVVSGFNVATTVWQLYLILFSPLWLKILVWNWFYTLRRCAPLSLDVNTQRIRSEIACSWRQTPL